MNTLVDDPPDDALKEKKFDVVVKYLCDTSIGSFIRSFIGCVESIMMWVVQCLLMALLPDRRISEY